MTGSLPVLDVAGLTDTGLRRERNEDNYDIRLPADETECEALFLVADGIGGMSGGDIASKAVVEEITRRYFAARTEINGAGGSYVDLLHSTIEETNVHIREQATKVGLMRIGSTVAGMLLRPSMDAIVFNVGDTRVYRVRGNDIEKLTRDQTLSEQQLEQGLITAAEARATRNSPITSFLGQPTPIAPAYQIVSAQAGDVFIICSDGLWNLVDDEEIHRVSIRYPAQYATKRLVDMTLRRGAPDNVTVIIVRIGRPPRTGPMLAWIAQKLNWG
ncbi:MAG: PP2C family serine/threonine-protein phosphatase [Anaerolineae bacterium]